MSRKRRFWKLFTLAFAAVLMASACGGDEGGSADSGGNGDLTSVNVRLDWLAQGPNSGFFVAEAKGYYEDNGLDVTLEEGEGSATTAQLIANKSATFGFADGYVVAQTAAQGAPLVMVASIYRQNPNGVIVPADSDIKSPEDLIGKSIGIPAGASQAQQWPAYLRGCDIDDGDVNVVSVDPGGAPQAVLEEKVDGIAGYVQGFAPLIEAGGTETRALWYADCGVSAVSNGVIVHADLLEEDPELIEKFVEATIRGFVYGRANPDEAIEIVTEFSEDIDPSIAMAQFELSWETYFSSGTEGTPLGYMAPEEWQSMVDVIETYGDIGDVPPAEELYTNEYVPEGDQYVPESG